MKLLVEPYWNGWRAFGITENGNKILLHTAMRTKADAIKAGKMEIEYFNGKENNLCMK